MCHHKTYGIVLYAFTVSSTFAYNRASFFLYCFLSVATCRISRTTFLFQRSEKSRNENHIGPFAKKICKNDPVTFIISAFKSFLSFRLSVYSHVARELLKGSFMEFDNAEILLTICQHASNSLKFARK
jgi:hypothetical protein